MSEATNISVIVVSFHTGAALEPCLDRLEAEPAAREIIGVDKGNPEPVRRILRSRAAASSKLKLLTGHGNVGFSRGCNLGAAQACGEGLAFINPDVLIEPGCLEALRDAAAGARSPCVIGARILWPDGRDQRGARRDIVTPWRAFVTALGLGRLENMSCLFRDLHRENDPLPAGPSRVGAVSGAAMYLPRKSFDALGGFDEGFFLHVEDIDICRRAAEAGGETLFSPDARVMHYRSTSEASSFFVERAKAAGFWRYFRKNARSPLGVLSFLAFGLPLVAAIFLRGLLRDVRRSPINRATLAKGA